jgi:uncharacterized protein (TIGR00299 family) protein
MARVIYLDCFSGVAGDMLLAALIDAGLPIGELTSALGSLGVGHELVPRRVTRAGLSATHLAVVSRDGQPDAADHAHPHTPGGAKTRGGHRTLVEIARLIDGSSLSASGKERATHLFRRLAEAEAAIHEVPLDEVHLHEVGAVDSIIDICGAVFALEWFAADEIISSPLNVGGGTVRIAHGVFPVPAPATLRLLQGVPVHSTGIQAELVTPTGALLVSDYATGYGPMPAMTIARSGYGAGTKDLGDVPNVLRVVIGDRDATAAHADGVVQIECEIDDMNPQLYGRVTDLILAAGALDVFLVSAQMKKGRPGTLLVALAPADRRPAVNEILFRETTTIGARFHAVEREVLERGWREVAIPGGVVRIKVASRNGEVLNAAPEFEDCLRIAEQTGEPVKTVLATAMAAWLELK